MVLQGSVQVTVCGSVVATKGVGEELGELGLLGGTGLAWSADVKTLPVCDLALTLTLTLTLTPTPTLTLTLTPALTLTLTLIPKQERVAEAAGCEINAARGEEALLITGAAGQQQAHA